MCVCIINSRLELHNDNKTISTNKTVVVVVVVIDCVIIILRRFIEYRYIIEYDSHDVVWNDTSK